MGIDLGTNSIGLTLREDTDFTWYGVYTFKKGVGEGKSGEFSYAAERTKHRASRRLYNARRYRKWETLNVLINNGYCPLSSEKLNLWKHYQKDKGRIFPVDDVSFSQWIKLDFNHDGDPDFNSPYQLRRLLITEKLDLSNPENRFKIGRAIYHIAQRRGFKSSRKSGVNEKTAVYKGSNETKTIGRNEYEDLIIRCGTLGAAFAYLEDAGVRVRNRYTLRSDYEAELAKILEFQDIDNLDFVQSLKKAVFYQRPLRSQKGLIGKCTLEPNKPRCPINHPRFEEFRARTFLNNIMYKSESDLEFKPLPIELIEKIYNAKFFYKSKREFKFAEIRKMIEENGGGSWKLNYSSKMDDVSVSSCYVSARFKSVFGETWQDFTKTVERVDRNGFTETVTYDIDEIWHIMFSYEDEECFTEFLSETLVLNENQIKELNTLFNSFPVGYANLSLKAINNILPFLREGFIYTEAVILAKIPEIIGKSLFIENKPDICSAIKEEFNRNRSEKAVISITNNLVAKYKNLGYNERFAWKDTSYKLQDSDYRDIEVAGSEFFGESTWNSNFSVDDRNRIVTLVASMYQAFFADENRLFRECPTLVTQVKEYLCANFEVDKKIVNRIYHPSQIDIYPSSEDQILLKSPKTAAFRNPMAYKTLYRLRDVLNFLIESNRIDSGTRIVLEIARELNDRNRRWAIEAYQRKREAENLVFKAAISELIVDRDFRGYANPESSEDIDKFRLWTEQMDQYEDLQKALADIDKDKSVTDKDVQKYRLWKEQGCKCFYTGKVISLTDLFDPNKIDFEHTIPRSTSFDNSLANLTVCYAEYNRNIKKNRLPVELPNYEKEALGYTAIKPRLEAWECKIHDHEKWIDYWRVESKNAVDKERKDLAIRQRYLHQMDLFYWANKVNRFKQIEVTQGFINSQLTDTQIITKYALHYLKTVFPRVDVIKGSTTAQFRKIYGVQPKSESKDRSKHYHHAIDAAVLTLIPPLTKRQEILQRHYDFDERPENRNKQYHVKPFPTFTNAMIEEIQKNILVNNIPDKDRTLTPAKRKVRKRGRIVWLDKQKQVPKIAQGDSIRGELHLQTYYSKIRLVERDECLKPLRDNEGHWKYLKGKEEFKYALRIPVEDLTSLDKLVSPELASIIEGQLDGRSLKKAISEGLYMLDKTGRKINRIRRVRVWQGVDPMQIKRQTYLSKKEYKNFYYAANAENAAFGFYKNSQGETAVIARNLFEISTFAKPNSISNLNELFEREIISKKGNILPLFHVFVPGQKVLFYETIKDELQDVDNFSSRLYYVRRLYQASAGNIQFQHHLEARDNKQLLVDFPEDKFGKKGVNGFSKFTNEFTAPRLLLSPGNFNFLIEGKDFEMKLDGTIRLF